MRVVVQRVRNAQVDVPETRYSASIGHGLLLLADEVEYELRYHGGSYRHCDKKEGRKSEEDYRCYGSREKRDYYVEHYFSRARAAVDMGR